MAEIREKVVKRSGRNAVSRLLHAKNDRETIVTWREELKWILQVFNVRSVVLTLASLVTPFQTELAVSAHVTMSGMRQDLSKIVRGEVGVQVHSVSSSCIRSFASRMMLTIA